MTNDLNPAGVEAARKASRKASLYVASTHDTSIEAAIRAYLAYLAQPEGETAELVERLRINIDVAADAFASLSQRLAAQAFEIEMLTRCGIIEVAVRNPNVADYMKHWEGRVEKAEARLAAVEAERDEATKLNNKYAWERDKAREERDVAERRSEAFWKPQLQAAEAQLAHARAAAIEECIVVVKRMLVYADTTSRSDTVAALRALGSGK